MLFTGVWVLLVISSFTSACVPPDPAFGGDIFTALTWSTLDTCKSPSHNISGIISEESEKAPRRRRKRTIFISTEPVLSCEFRYIFPLIPVSDEFNTFISLQIPMNFQMNVPFIGVTPRSLDQGSVAVFSKIEEVIAMAGMDGRACLMRSMCEVASMGPLNPKGLVGELINIGLKYATKSAHHNESEPVSETYLDAAAKGRTGVDCSLEYDCPVSLLNLFHTSENSI